MTRALEQLLDTATAAAVLPLWLTSTAGFVAGVAWLAATGQMARR